MKTLLIIVLGIYTNLLFAQEQIVISQWSANDTEFDIDLGLNSSITFGFDCTGLEVKVGGNQPIYPKVGNDKQFAITASLFNQKPEIVLTVKCSLGTRKIKLKRHSEAVSGSDSSVSDFFTDASMPADVKRHLKNKARYDRKKNEAYLFLDENGAVFGRKPVNLDEDDILFVHMMVRRSEIANHKITITGEYAPDDLQFRPSEELVDIDESGAQAATDTDDPWVLLPMPVFGPFTSDDITIAIDKRDSEGGKFTSLVSYGFKINNLYHVAVGASFVNTNLAKPDFIKTPLPSGDSTISAINNGSRTLATFNVIWYWKPTVDWVTGKLGNESHITRGRDILKEATFCERLNPTFGISLDKSFRENFFAGATFEFARGGSLTAGWHYGKTKELLDQNFKLGETPYPVHSKDIITTDVWKWSGFFGITLDNRIFNRLFRSQK